jgi:hypothetical protein
MRNTMIKRCPLRVNCSDAQMRTATPTFYREVFSGDLRMMNRRDVKDLRVHTHIVNKDAYLLNSTFSIELTKVHVKQ